MLNTAQRQAVEAGGHCLVAAGPGSGKTRVLSERGARLLTLNPSHRLCAVTFTSDAAKELAHRMIALAPNASRRIIHGTFHALCKRQLVQSSRQVRLVNDASARDYLRRAYAEIADEGYAGKFDEFETAIAELKADPDYSCGVLAEGSLDRGLTIYNDALRANGVLDFSDLILSAVAGMRDGSVAPLQVEHLLVDEFQDTDKAQFAWMQCHLDAGRIITVVGDDDQSIYGWRQAMGYEGMARFATLSRAEHVVLDTTYRCARSIIRSAATLISLNTERIPKNLRTSATIDGEIRVEACRTRLQEVQLIAQRIANSGNPDQWAVLARTNALLDALETEIGDRFPYIRSGSESFWALKAPRIFVGLVRSLLNNDMLGIDALLGNCGVPASELKLLAQTVRSTVPGAALRFARHSSSSEGELSVATLRLRAVFDEWIRGYDNGDYGNVFRAMARFIERHVHWGGRENRRGEAPPADRERLVQCADRFERASAGDLRIFLNNLERNTETKQTTGARLMTLHGSKGLEFDCVWIMGCERGIFPPATAIGKLLEEERRLMYVGITRARKELTVSYSTDGDAAASEFIDQAGLFHHSAQVA